MVGDYMSHSISSCVAVAIVTPVLIIADNIVTNRVDDMILLYAAA